MSPPPRNPFGNLANHEVSEMLRVQQAIVAHLQAQAAEHARTVYALQTELQARKERAE